MSNINQMNTQEINEKAKSLINEVKTKYSFDDKQAFHVIRCRVKACGSAEDYSVLEAALEIIKGENNE